MEDARDSLLVHDLPAPRNFVRIAAFVAQKELPVRGNRYAGEIEKAGMTYEFPRLRYSSHRWFPLLSMVLLLVASVDASGVYAAPPDDADVGRTPPRLSLIVGEVSFWRPGTENWVAAQLNMPLDPGDALYAGSGARAEVQIGGRAFVRLGDATQLELVNQEPDFVQLRVGSGRAALDLRELARGHTVQLDTPNAAVTIDDPGYYRIDVTEDMTTLATRRGGRARVRVDGEQPTDIGPNDRMVITGIESPALAVYNAPALDDWDHWNYERTDLVLASESSRYLPRDVYGAEALDNYGTWQVEPTYGPVWVPSYVSPGWAPYSTGQWVWGGYYGWTWVDAAPWGWAPYHYGRWVHLRNCWGWAPGPIVVRPAYAPALVAFFGGPGVRVGIGVPFVSWVALGWGEPLVPWWGRPGFVGVPCWRGWGGPHVVNNVFINKTTIIHAPPRAFANTRVHNGVITVAHNDFGRRPIRLRGVNVNPNTLRPLGGHLPVRPVSLGGRTSAPQLPHGAVTRAGTDAPRMTINRRPERGATTAAHRPAPPVLTNRSGGEQRLSSHPDVRQAPLNETARSEGVRSSAGGSARREAPPPPGGGSRDERSSSARVEARQRPQPPAQRGSGSERRVDAPRAITGAGSAAPVHRAPAMPVQEAARERPQGFSAPAAPRAPQAPQAPQQMSAPAAPPARAEAMAPSPYFRGGSQMPHAAPASRSTGGVSAGSTGAPAPSYGSGGAAPRGHAVHQR
jgi:Family of unknown function (DUF6600)